MERSRGTARLATAVTGLALLSACAAPAGTAPARPVATHASGMSQAGGATTTAVRAPGSGAVRAASAQAPAKASAQAPARRCRTTGLRAKTGAQDAGAGQRYAALVLTNTSSKTCWVYGFVGLIMIDGHGDALRTRTRRESVTPHRVTLRPGASAHARLHWTVVPGGSETTCPASARLMIIPPDEVAHLEIPFKAAVCGDGRIDVTPMAPGVSL
ncbi:DUF4232 domain-containing protein [Microbispora sp. NPDC049125]|uniref:DUF4232 domain-containing protein n=1 Tax=Microbispora sp. NPDC049125 TaxID=3154929 RepID=UPI003464ED6E